MKRFLFVITLLATFAAQPSIGKDHATGFIRVEQINSALWFTNAEGERFVSLGVNHIEPHLWLAPYNKEATLKRYGEDVIGEDCSFNSNGEAAKKWINRQVEVTQSLHFNTFGPHTHGAIDPMLYKELSLKI